MKCRTVSEASVPVASAAGSVSIDVRHELLNSAHVVCEQRSSVGRFQLRLATRVADDLDERFGIQCRQLADLTA